MNPEETGAQSLDLTTKAITRRRQPWFSGRFISTDSKQGTSRRSEFWAGFKATFPLVVGAIPFGIIFGALAVKNGLTPTATQAMSLLVFAGSSQFIAIGLLAAGASTTIIILTTFVVNLRHVLYAATLSPHMKHLSQKWLAPLGFWLTDESFLVSIARYNQNDSSPYKHWFFFGSAVFMYSNWQLCTWIGIVGGTLIQDPGGWGLDFAMIVTFIGMLVPSIKNRNGLFAILVAGFISILARSLPYHSGLFIAAFAGIITGVISEQIIPPSGDQPAKDGGV